MPVHAFAPARSVRAHGASRRPRYASRRCPGRCDAVIRFFSRQLGSRNSENRCAAAATTRRRRRRALLSRRNPPGLEKPREQWLAAAISIGLAYLLMILIRLETRDARLQTVKFFPSHAGFFLA